MNRGKRKNKRNPRRGKGRDNKKSQKEKKERRKEEIKRKRERENKGEEKRQNEVHALFCEQHIFQADTLFPSPFLKRARHPVRHPSLCSALLAAGFPFSRGIQPPRCLWKQSPQSDSLCSVCSARLSSYRVPLGSSSRPADALSRHVLPADSWKTTDRSFSNSFPYRGKRTDLICAR